MSCISVNSTISTHIERETGNQLGMALQGQLDMLCSHGFIPTIVYTDPALGFQVIVNQFPRVINDVGGAQDNNAKVDIKICRIKEVYLGSSVTRINILRMTAINLNVCPKVLLQESR